MTCMYGCYNYSPLILCLDRLCQTKRARLYNPLPSFSLTLSLPPLLQAPARVPAPVDLSYILGWIDFFSLCDRRRLERVIFLFFPSCCCVTTKDQKWLVKLFFHRREFTVDLPSNVDPSETSYVRDISVDIVKVQGYSRCGHDRLRSVWLGLTIVRLVNSLRYSPCSYFYMLSTRSHRNTQS